jgi:hypothetical protein
MPRHSPTMSALPSKANFLAYGLIDPYIPVESMEYDICFNPLITSGTPLIHDTESPQNGSSKHEHAECTTTDDATAKPAIRVKKCGHVFGKDCFMAWVDISDTCPKCRDRYFGRDGSLWDLLQLFKNGELSDDAMSDRLHDVLMNRATPDEQAFLRRVVAQTNSDEEVLGILREPEPLFALDGSLWALLQLYRNQAISDAVMFPRLHQVIPRATGNEEAFLRRVASGDCSDGELLRILRECPTVDIETPTDIG